MSRYHFSAPMRAGALSLACIFTLGGCVTADGPSYTGAVSPLAHGPAQEIELGGNYNALVQCWQQETARQPGRFGSRAQVRIDEDRKFAEITMPGGGNTSAARLELRRAGPNRSAAKVYAASSAGETRLREWLEVLKACQSKVAGDG